MNHSTLVSIIVLGLASTSGCAATEYERSSVPDRAPTAPRLDLTVDDASATPSFPARLSSPTAPRAADRVAARVVAELDGRARTDVRLCVGGNGAVTNVALVRGSGIDELDAALLAEARSWRYQPLAIASATVCQKVEIGYTVR